MKIRFKQFLMNENRAYLGDKIGDLLNAVHDIDDGSALGTRQMLKFCEKLVAAIRRILHSNWPQTEQKYLKKLQKIAVAIMNSIEQKDDLRELLPAVRQELEELSSSIGMPINDLGGGQEDKSPENAPEGKKPPTAKPAQGQPAAPPGQETQPPGPPAPMPSPV